MRALNASTVNLLASGVLIVSLSSLEGALCFPSPSVLLHLLFPRLPVSLFPSALFTALFLEGYLQS